MAELNAVYFVIQTTFYSVIMRKCVFFQLKAKTEMLLSAEAAKAAQKANLENNLETAQHALQDKQQVGLFFGP